jgi:hypothetical protein
VGRQGPRGEGPGGQEVRVWVWVARQAGGRVRRRCGRQRGEDVGRQGTKGESAGRPCAGRQMYVFGDLQISKIISILIIRRQCARGLYLVLRAIGNGAPEGQSYL